MYDDHHWTDEIRDAEFEASDILNQPICRLIRKLVPREVHSLVALAVVAIAYIGVKVPVGQTSVFGIVAVLSMFFFQRHWSNEEIDGQVKSDTKCRSKKAAGEAKEGD